MQADNQLSWYCPKCGNKNLLNFKHCTECGTGLPPGASVGSAPPAQAESRKVAGGQLNLKHFGYVLVGIVAFGALILVAGLLLQPSREQVTRSNPPVKTTPVMTPSPTLSYPVPGVTMANYEKLQTGMSYYAVTQILGKDGTELSSNEIAGHRTIMYQWKSDGFGNMNVMFQNERMIQKAQFGLK